MLVRLYDFVFAAQRFPKPWQLRQAVTRYLLMPLLEAAPVGYATAWYQQKVAPLLETASKTKADMVNQAFRLPKPLYLLSVLSWANKQRFVLSQMMQSKGTKL